MGLKNSHYIQLNQPNTVELLANSPANSNVGSVKRPADDVAVSALSLAALNTKPIPAATWPTIMIEK